MDSLNIEKGEASISTDLNTPQKKCFSDCEIIEIPSSPHAPANSFLKPITSVIPGKKHSKNN